MKMSCSECDKEADILFPVYMDKDKGKEVYGISVQRCICKECLNKFLGDKQ